MKGRKKFKDNEGSNNGENRGSPVFLSKVLEPLKTNQNHNSFANFSKGIAKVAANSSTLEQAIQNGLVSNAVNLISKSNVVDLSTSNALKLAFEVNKGDNFEVIKALIDRQVSSSGGKPFFPLQKSIKQGLEKVSNYLIEKKVGLNVVDENDYSPLYQSIKKEDEQITLSLIQAGADPDTRINPEKETVLINIVRWDGKINPAIKVLIGQGANLYLQDNHHKSAMDYASQRGGERVEYIKWLTIGEYVDKVSKGIALDVNVDTSIHDTQIQNLFMSRFVALKNKGLVKPDLDLQQYRSKLPASLLKEMQEEVKGLGKKEEYQQGQQFEKEELNMKAKVEAIKDKINKAKLQQNSKLEVETVQQMIETIAEGNNKIIGNEEQVNIIWGYKGSGKTTLANVFAGNQLKGVLESDSGEVLLESVNQSDLEIGSTTLSKTKTPNKKFTQIGTVIDLPGCNELSIDQEIANMYFMHKAYSQHKQVKFILAVEESMIKSGKGLGFLNLVKQFCGLFKDPSTMEKGTALIITQADRQKNVSNIEAQIKKLIDQGNIEHEVKKMLEVMTKNLQVFHKPEQDTIIETNQHSLVSFVQGKEFATLTSEMVKLPLSAQAQMYGAELLNMAVNGLELIAQALLEASLHPDVSSVVGQDNTFSSSYDQLKKWAPSGFTYQHAIPMKQRYSDQYFSEIKRLMKLEDIGKELKNSKDLVSVSRVMEKLLNAFEEYVIIPNTRPLADSTFATEAVLKEQIKSLAYLTKQFTGYVTLLPQLLGSKAVAGDCCEQLNSLLKESVGIFNEQVSTLLRAAVFELDLSSLTSDVDYFVQAIKILDHYKGEDNLKEKKALCYQSIADIWKKGQAYDTALANYYLAIKFNPKLLTAYEQVAEILDLQNRPDMALPFYKLTKNFDKIVSCYNKLIFIQNSDYALEEKFGDALLDIGFLPEAQVHYNSAFCKAKDFALKAKMQEKVIQALSPRTKEKVIEKLQVQINTGKLYEFEQFDIHPYTDNLNEAVVLGEVNLEV